MRHDANNEVRYLGRHAAPGTAVYWGKRDQPCDGMVNPHTLDRGADGKEIPGSTTLDRLCAGQYRVLLGSQKSSEGTNLERNLSFVAAMGPQPSQENFLQQAGRGGRRIPGKVVPFLILVNMEHEYAKMAVGVGSMRQANKDKKEEIKDLYSGRTCLVQAIESAFNTRAKDLGPCRMRCSVCDGRIFTLPPALPRADVTDGLKAVLERAQPWVVWEVVQVGGRNAASVCWVLWAREGGIVAALQVEVPAPLIDFELRDPGGLGFANGVASSLTDNEKQRLDNLSGHMRHASEPGDPSGPGPLRYKLAALLVHCAPLRMCVELDSAAVKDVRNAWAGEWGALQSVLSGFLAEELGNPTP